MSAPVFVVPSEALAAASAGSEVLLDGSEGRHAATVRRLAVGEPIRLVDGAGRSADGHVVGVEGKSSLTVAVDAVQDEPVEQPRFVVAQALAKGDRGELAVELLTEVGVDEIVPWSAANCVVRWRADRADRSRQRWVDASVAAAKQARRARFPVMAELSSTDDLCGRVAQASLAVVLHEEATTPLSALAPPASGEVLVIVGPEGGLSPDERRALVDAGAHEARLGPTVMRTSSAGMAATAALLSRTPRWQAWKDDRHE